MNENTIITQLNGKKTELTEEEIALLFDYRLADKECRKEIEELINNAKSE